MEQLLPSLLHRHHNHKHSIPSTSPDEPSPQSPGAVCHPCAQDSPLPSCLCVQERLHLQHAALVVKRLRHEQQLLGGLQQHKEPAVEQRGVGAGQRGLPAPKSLCGVGSWQLSPAAAPHRTDPSLHAAARNLQGAGSCSVVVPGTTERDMYLGKHTTLAPHPLPQGEGVTAQPEPSLGRSSGHWEVPRTEPLPNPKAP